MSKLHVDATLAAAHRMAELQAENEQLKERIGDLEQNLRVAESARDDARAESQRPARSVKELVAEAVALRDQMRNMPPAATEAELDSLYAYARGRLDPNRDREPVVCACSSKYRELGPGVHAAYCPLAGRPA